MTKRQKLIEKILAGKNVAYEDAEKILLYLGYALEIRGSHHIFRKDWFFEKYFAKKAFTTTVLSSQIVKGDIE